MTNRDPSMTLEEWFSLPKLFGSRYLAYYISYVNIKLSDRRLSPGYHMNKTILGYVKSGVDFMSDCGLMTKW